VTGEVTDIWPESDARSSSLLRIHPQATPSDAIGVRAISGIKDRISYSKTEPQLDSSLVKQHFRETFSLGRLSRLWQLIIAGLFPFINGR
jgi:hypothetical protein